MRFGCCQQAVLNVVFVAFAIFGVLAVCHIFKGGQSVNNQEVEEGEWVQEPDEPAGM